MIIDFLITRTNIASGVATFTLPESYDCQSIKLVKAIINTTIPENKLHFIYCVIGGISNLKPLTQYNTATREAKSVVLGGIGYNKLDIELVHKPTLLAVGTNITFTLKRLTPAKADGPPVVWSQNGGVIDDTEEFEDGEGGSTQFINITLDLKLQDSFDPTIND